MLQNPRKTFGFKKKVVYKIPPGGEVNHIQPVAYLLSYWYVGLRFQSYFVSCFSIVLSFVDIKIHSKAYKCHLKASLFLMELFNAAKIFVE